MEVALFAVLFLAVAAGFLLGKRQSVFRGGASAKTRNFEQRYLAGLNQLLKDQPDAAVEIFVASLDVNGDTLETHLAMGALLRRRGEVDKAIRIHQNLLAHPGLSAKQGDLVQLELALDYKKSGLLDRQEVLLKELCRSADPSVRSSALAQLVHVYQDGQEWQKAIETTDLLCQKAAKSELAKWRHLQAHFCCELADQARQSGSQQGFFDWTGRALSYESSNARAALNMASWELDKGNAKSALKWLDKVAREPYLAQEVVVMAEGVFEKLHAPEKLYAYLVDLHRKHPNPGFVLPLADEIARRQGDQAALAFLQKESASVEALKVVADCLALIDSACLQYQSVRKLTANHLPSPFSCQQCGFHSHRVYWCCPTCRYWL